MNLPTPPEKLEIENRPTRKTQVVNAEQFVIVVEKLNEYHDFSKQLVAYLKEREHLPNCTLIRYGTGYGCNCKAEPAQEPPQEKECKHNWIGYSSTERMECTKCGEKSSPSQQIDVVKLMHEYGRLWYKSTTFTGMATSAERIEKWGKRMSEIEEIIKNNLK